MDIVRSLSHYTGAVMRGIRTGSLWRTTAKFLRYARIERQVAAHYESAGGLTVQGGVFAGMRYIRIPANHGFIPKLLGFYEEELHPVWQTLAQTPYDRMINVGSAEGYYAVGFALKQPRLTVYTFDSEPREQAMCREMTRINGVESRVHVGGYCDAPTLQRLIEGKTLILSDREGCEYDLLDPARVPALTYADMLVEVHDFGGDTRIGNALQARFAGTHDFQRVISRVRRADDYPLLSVLPDAQARDFAVLERDVEQHWFVFRARQGRQS